MSEVSKSAEWSALEKTITTKLGSGHGTTVLLSLLKKVHDLDEVAIVVPFTQEELTESYASIPVAELEPVPPEPSVEVTESSP